MTITRLQTPAIDPTGADAYPETEAELATIRERAAARHSARKNRAGTIFDPLYEQPWTEIDVAEFLGRSDRFVRELRKTDPTFPSPTRFIGSTPTWQPQHLRAWVAGDDFENTEYEAPEQIPAPAPKRNKKEIDPARV